MGCLLQPVFLQNADSFPIEVSKCSWTADIWNSEYSNGSLVLAMQDIVHLYILSAVLDVLPTQPLLKTVQHLLVTDQDQEDQNSLGEETMIRNGS
jgi:hypothetical protein